MFDLIRTIRFAGAILGFAAMTVGSYYAMDEFDVEESPDNTRGFSGSSNDFAVKESIAASEERDERNERARLTDDYSALSDSSDSE